MATSGKKQKKNKWKAVDPGLIINTSALPVKPVSWGEQVETEEREQLFSAARPAQNIVLPSAPRASIDADVYERSVPHEGPYLAYLTNLSFDIAEEDIYEFFQELKVARVDLPRDDRSGNGGRCKGYGHVEFEDRTSLIEALGFIDASIKGRRVRINLPNAAEDRSGRGGGMGGANSERRQYRDRNNQDRDRGGEDPERTSGDWRSAPRAEVEERRRPYGGRDSYNRDRDERQGRSPRRGGGGFRSEDTPATMTRDDFGTAKPTALPERSRGGFTERGPGSGREGGGRDGGGGGRMFDRSEMKDPSLAAATSPERERGGENRFAEGRSERPSRAADTGRSFDRTEMREPPPKDLSPVAGGEPKTRPKLNLAPRTKPLEVVAPLPQPPLDPEPAAPAPPSSSEEPDAAPPPPAGGPPKPTAASIFGGARPVDTAAREREIEEKLRRAAALAGETDAPAAQPHRSRDPSPHPVSSKDPEVPPSPPENVWTKRSQQLTSSNITNGDTSPVAAVPVDGEPSSEAHKEDAASRSAATEEAEENDENRQPPAATERDSRPPAAPAGTTPAPTDEEEEFELSKDRRRRGGGGGTESSGGGGEGWREGGGRGGAAAPPRRNLEERNSRDYGGGGGGGGPRGGDRDMNRGFRNNEDRSKRPFNRDNRDSRDNRDFRDSRGPPREITRDSQGPRRNFDSDKPPRSRDDRGPDDSREIRRNPNNTRAPPRREGEGEEMRRGGGRPGAPNNSAPSDAPSPPTPDPAKVKLKKAKAPIDDIAKMPKVQEAAMPNFAQGNKFATLLADEEGEEVEEDM